MPSKKSKGKASSSKESAVSRSPASESITVFLKNAWREDDSLPFDKAKVAAQAAARGEHTSAVMYSQNTTPLSTTSSPNSASSSSSGSSSSSSSSSSSVRPVQHTPQTTHGRKNYDQRSKRFRLEASPEEPNCMPSSATFFSPRSGSAINAAAPIVSGSDPISSKQASSSKKKNNNEPLALRSAAAAASLLLPKPTADAALRAYHKRELYDMDYTSGHCFFEAVSVSYALTCGMSETQGAHLVRALYSFTYGSSTSTLLPLLNCIDGQMRDCETDTMSTWLVLNVSNKFKHSGGFGGLVVYLAHAHR